MKRRAGNRRRAGRRSKALHVGARGPNGRRVAAERGVIGAEEEDIAGWTSVAPASRSSRGHSSAWTCRINVAYADVAYVLRVIRTLPWELPRAWPTRKRSTTARGGSPDAGDATRRPGRPRRRRYDGPMHSIGDVPGQLISASWHVAIVMPRVGAAGEKDAGASWIIPRHGAVSKDVHSGSPTGGEGGSRDAHGWVYHELYMWHDTGRAAPQGARAKWLQAWEHYENPETKRRFRNLVEVAGLFDDLIALKPRMATVDEILRFHTRRTSSRFAR